MAAFGPTLLVLPFTLLAAGDLARRQAVLEHPVLGLAFAYVGVRLS